MAIPLSHPGALLARLHRHRGVFRLAHHRRLAARDGDARCVSPVHGIRDAHDTLAHRPQPGRFDDGLGTPRVRLALRTNAARPDDESRERDAAAFAEPERRESWMTKPGSSAER